MNEEPTYTVCKASAFEHNKSDKVKNYDVAVPVIKQESETYELVSQLCYGGYLDNRISLKEAEEIITRFLTRKNQ